MVSERETAFQQYNLQFSTSSVPGAHKAVFFIHTVFMRPRTAPHSVLRSSCAHRCAQIQGARDGDKKNWRSAGKRTRLEGLGKTTGITMKHCKATFALRFNTHCHNTVGGIQTKCHNIIMCCTQCCVRDTNPGT